MSFLKKKECRLQFFNIAFFASVMGFWGLTLATHKLEEVFKLHFHASYYILLFSFAYFIAISILYIIKIFLNFSDVKADFHHPVKSNFFPWIGKIFFIFSIAFFTYSEDFSRYLFFLGVIFQLFFTIIILRRWIVKDMDIKAMNPLWFLPIVGNMITPIAWVKLGYIEFSLFMFAVGFILWCVLFTVIMNRIIFHNPLPQKLLPTLFILIAPPAIGFISYTTLAWEMTMFGKMLYYFSLFMFFIILSKINILSKVKFFLSWWAYSFPMAALTIATIVFYSKTHIPFIAFLSFVFYTLLVCIIILLLFLTFRWVKKKELCIEEE